MKRLVFLAAFAATAAATAAETNSVDEAEIPFYTNLTIKVGGTNLTVRARRFTPDFKILERRHGKQVGIEKDSMTGEITWVYADGHRVSRRLPKKLANDPKLFPYLNRDKIEKASAKKEEGGK